MIGNSTSWYRRDFIINTHGLSMQSFIIAYTDRWPYGYRECYNEIVSNQKIKCPKYDEQCNTCVAYESNCVVVCKIAQVFLWITINLL